MYKNRALSHLALAALALMPLVAVAQDSEPGGTLYGVVKDENGKVVTEATVSYNRVPGIITEEDGIGPAKVRVAPQGPFVNRQVATRNDGTFEVRALPPGDYVVCAGKDGFLNSCQWSGVHLVTVGVGSVADAGEFTLVVGGEVRIVIRDRGRFVKLTTDAPIGGQDPIVGVMTKEGGFHPAQLDETEDERAEFFVRVPLEQELTLWVFSRAVALRTATGASVDASGPNQAFRVTSKAPLRVFDIEAVGRSTE